MSATLTTIATAPTLACAHDGDPSLFHRARTWLLLVALFLMAQGNGLFTRQDNSYWNLKELTQRYDFSKPSLLVLTVLMWGLCLGLMVKGIGPTLRLMLKHKALLACALLAFLSTLWSEDPEFTFRKATLLSLGFAFAWFFATYYSPTDQSRLLLAAGVIVALASIVMALLLPEYGIASTGEWKGVFGHKNQLGLCISYLFSSLPFCRLSSKRQDLTLAFQAILPLGLILLSQSRTALIMAAVLVAVRVLGPYIASRRRDQLPFVLFAAACGIVLTALTVIEGRDIITILLGRDSTLSGRTEHWAVLLPYMLQHLWLGYGYEAFWLGNGDSLHVITRIGGAMKGADSGYVDTMLSLGLLGLAALFIVALARVYDFVRLIRNASVPLIAYWYAGLILATFVGMFTESLFLTPIGVATFIFVVACAGLQSLSYRGASTVALDSEPLSYSE